VERVLKVRKKGVIILPKKLRQMVGIDEESEVIVKVEGDKLVIRALKPKVVDIDPKILKKLLEEERSIDRERLRRLLKHE